MVHVVTLTINPAVDVSVEADRVVPTQKIRCSSLQRDPGGGGINVARAMRVLGGKPIALYTAGGASGDFIETALRREAVDQERVHIKATTRENLAVLERSSGKQYRFDLPGPSMHEAEWRACLERLSELEPEYVVGSGSLPPDVPADFYARAARLAKAKSMRFILDASGEALRAALEEGVFLVKPNLREFAELTGHKADQHADQESIAHQLIANGATQIVALTLGADGALLVWRDNVRRLRAPSVESKGAVGAGDSFVAGLTFGLAGGRSLEDSFQLAVAAGTAALLTPGTKLCRREDVHRLYRQITFE